MAEFEVKQIDPGWRGDHADFGNVRDTTYAKGIITDFKQVQDNPIKVESQVKVKIVPEGEEEEGEETDFLPLFYKPKAGYWDDSEHQATDFNAEGKYYERAWMSFRCGDEVIVMLKEGQPVAVLGFDDGLGPDVGETVIAFEVAASGYSGGLLSFSDRWHIWMIDLAKGPYIDAELGPDGKPLNLIKECEQEGPTLINHESSSWTGGPGGDCHFQQSIDTYSLRLITLLGPLKYVFEIYIVKDVLVRTATGENCTDALGISWNCGLHKIWACIYKGGDEEEIDQQELINQYGSLLLNPFSIFTVSGPTDPGFPEFKAFVKLHRGQ